MSGQSHHPDSNVAVLEQPGIAAVLATPGVSSETGIETAQKGTAKFAPDWDAEEAEQKEKLRRQLAEELDRMKNISGISDDQEKLKEIFARYTPQEAHYVVLDAESHAKLAGGKASISEEGMNRKQTDALADVLREHLPNTQIEIIPVTTASGEQRFAFKGISADEANAVVKMHYIKTMAEAQARGEHVEMGNPDKMTTKELDFAVADMEIARRERGIAGQGQERERGQAQERGAPRIDDEELAAAVSRAAGRHRDEDAPLVTSEALARVAAMASSVSAGHEGQASGVEVPSFPQTAKSRKRDL